jgi:hypothetical protein
VTDYFVRLNVKLANANLDAPPTGQQLIADFKPGSILTNFTLPDASSALEEYSNVLERFPFLNGGLTCQTQFRQTF